MNGGIIIETSNYYKSACAHEKTLELFLHLALWPYTIICVVAVSATISQTWVADVPWHLGPGPTASSEVLLISVFHTQGEQSIHPAPEQLWGLPRLCSPAGSWSAPTLRPLAWKVLCNLWTSCSLSWKQTYSKLKRGWNLCPLFSPREYAGGANSFLLPAVLNHTHRFVKWMWVQELESPSA